MKLSDFDYVLPQELIAQFPLEKRDQARLMVVDRVKKTISHDVFCNLEKYLPAKSILVLNDSKVMRARLFGKREKTGGNVEIFLLKQLSDGNSFKALIRPLKRLNVNEKIIFNGGKVFAELMDPQEKIVRFNRKNILKDLKSIGHVPLPPYIKRMDAVSDEEFYQTVYAKNLGSVASPTAGLHFTKPLLSKLKRQGHEVKNLTLHVNYATFKPVTEEDLTKETIHFEDYDVTKKVWDDLESAKAENQRIVAIGTTSCRVLETVSKTKKLNGETNIFIRPGFEFQMTDHLVTNFHLPKSTLFMLVSAFAGRNLIMKAYTEAIREKYRFYSYGDAMIIL